MKTKEDLQAAVDEIRAVCSKHGVVLVGTCEREDIYGEITIGDAAGVMRCWRKVAARLDNAVLGDAKRGYAIGGIGDINDSDNKCE